MVTAGSRRPGSASAPYSCSIPFVKTVGSGTLVGPLPTNIIVWAVVATVLVLGLFAYGAIGLVDIRGAQTAEFEVNIKAEQWVWHYEYPAAGVISKELHIPVGRRVHLIINSIDVIHSFWVPAFGVKQDAVPGHPTQIYLTATHPGTYPGMCSELCGLGHTSMTTTVVVSDQAALDAWLSKQPPEPSKEPE